MIFLQLTCGFWAPHAGWGSISGFLLLCQKLQSLCSSQCLGCRELKFCELRWIKALCVGGPVLLLWLRRAPVSVLLGLCKERMLCRGLGFGSTQGTILFLWWEGWSCHEDEECSCFNGHTELSSGSMLARLPLALGVGPYLLFPALGPNGSSSLHAAALAAWLWSNQPSSKHK